ncbi:MAG: NAD(+)/NADH kinase [Myxococcales bacterium]|nr:MAG: NAD(+)/NADH kinase [Myxococcales bacterium]
MTKLASRHGKKHRNESRPKVLAIYKKSAFQLYVQERKLPEMKRLLQKRDRSVERLRESHDAHVKGVSEATRILRSLGAKVVLRYRGDAGNADDFDFVVTLGGDGTLLWASHFVPADIPIMGINTAPKDSVGHFCAGHVKDLKGLFQQALDQELAMMRLSRMRVEVDEVLVSNRILNDVLFAHECPAATSRYLIEHNGKVEDQKSSGIWVGPAAGSTAARRSAGGHVMRIQSKRLEYVVREPYFEPTQDYKMTRGYIEDGSELEIQSKMRPGKLYLDGSRLQFAVPFGSTIRMTRSDEPLLLFGYRRMKNKS